MKLWRYALPLACFLIYGGARSGTVYANTKSEARAVLKRRFGVASLPAGTQLIPV